MSIAVGTNDAGHRLLILQCRILEGVHILRTGKVVFLEVDSIDQIVPKCWKARLVLVFMITDEKLLVTANTLVHADVLHPPEITCERPLMAFSLSHIVLERGQFVFEEKFPFLNVTLPPSLEGLDVAPLPWFRGFAFVFILHKNLVNDASICHYIDRINFVHVRLYFS